MYLIKHRIYCHFPAMRSTYPFPSFPLILLLIALFSSFRVVADTGDSTRYLTFKDTLLVSVNEWGEKVIEHRMEKKQTLYGLAKFYGLNAEELYPYNAQINVSTLHPGAIVHIPIPNAGIRRFYGKDFARWKFANLYYVTRKGDTMYKIARTYFRMPVDSLKARNGLQSDVVAPGIRLHVGWISTAGIPDSVRVNRQTGSDWQKSLSLQKSFAEQSGKKVVKEAKGVAYWQKNGTKYSELYCLHREAVIGTTIAVTNPMKNKTVYAKVIGRIPPGAYSQEVIIIISPTVAQMLGAIDGRFYVKIKYFE